jgi:hypothetical protein
MSQMFARLLRIIVGITLILLGLNRAAQAQSLPSSEPPPTAPPNPDQTPAPTPSINQTNPNPANPVEPTPEPKRRRRFRPQIGLGGNIGVTGNTGFSQGGVAIMNRTDFNDYISFRGTNVFGGERRDSSLALTFNMPIRSASGQVRVAPFVGGGALISSKSFFEDVWVRGLVTSGIDIPLSKRFSATSAVNVGFTDRANMGVQIGVMYRF